jgi:predicted RNA-binding Zn ribbon-like protein
LSVADTEFLLLGDAVWLEFANTRPVNGRRDALPDPQAYLRWTKALRLEPPDGAVSFDQARSFRDQLVNLAQALQESRRPPGSAIEAVNARLAPLEGRERLLRVGGRWRIQFAPARPPGALEAIARSVAETLANPLAVVRLCANEECGLFLIDDSPGRGRRWCSRARCGTTGRIERRRRSRPTPLVPET